MCLHRYIGVSITFIELYCLIFAPQVNLFGYHWITADDDNAVFAVDQYFSRSTSATLLSSPGNRSLLYEWMMDVYFHWLNLNRTCNVTPAPAFIAAAHCTWFINIPLSHMIQTMKHSSWSWSVGFTFELVKVVYSLLDTDWRQCQYEIWIFFYTLIENHVSMYWTNRMKIMKIGKK